MEGGVRLDHHSVDEIVSTAARVSHGDTDPNDPESPPVPKSHPTAVASVMAGSGDTDMATIGGTSFNDGNFSRGVAFGAKVRAYDRNDIQSEIGIEAATSPPLRAANFSFGAKVGWHFDTDTAVPAPKWRWFGLPSAASIEDFKLGAYLGGTLANQSPREMDERAGINRHTLLVWAAGNDRNEGPGALPAGGYRLGQTSTISTQPRDWNDGDGGGYDSLPPEACAKNVLTVGAHLDAITSWDAGSGTLVYTTLPASSPSYTAAGPTDDGRIKPDLVACGSRAVVKTLNARNPFGWNSPRTAALTAVNEYTLCPPTADNQFCGTSFSAPVATGTVALLLQKRHQVCPGWENNAFLIHASALRALMVHTAKDLGPVGPDFITGYGLLNSAAAVKLMADECVFAWNGWEGWQAPKPFVRETQIKSGEAAQFKLKAASASAPLIVTIAWTDPAGPAQASINGVDPQTARLVHDLDLRVYPPGTTVFDDSTAYKPWRLNPDLSNKNPAVRGAAATTDDDSLNNLEQVVITTPVTTGDYIVRVTHKGALPTEGQWVSIISSGVTGPPNGVAPFNLSGVIQGDQPGGVTFALTFDSVVGGVYTVQGDADLAPPWTDHIVNIVAIAESTMVAVTTPPGATRYFWRVLRTY